MNTRKKDLHIRLSEKERSELEQKAKEANTNLCDYLRSTALGYKINPYKNSLQYHELTRELLRQYTPLGGNLNQITRRLNGSQYAERKDIQELKPLLLEVRKIWLDIRRQLHKLFEA